MATDGGLMKYGRAFVRVACLPLILNSAAAAESDWPPAMRGVVEGYVSVQSPKLLNMPEALAAKRTEAKIVSFEVAKSPPRVEMAWHRQLGDNASQRRLWSSWGDIVVARDGRVYCAIGDHGDDVGGDARCFVYCWDPQRKRLDQVVDMNRIVPRRKGQPAWSKIHAKLDEGNDGRIYFSCTLNAGDRASQERYGFNDVLPGGQLYRYDPPTGQAEVVANLPPRRCTATSLFDHKRNVWWCNLEAGNGNALWGIDLATKRVIYQGPDGSVGFNRAFALLHDGDVLYNGDNSLHRLDADSGQVTVSTASLPASPGLRCATAESKGGHVYGIAQKTNLLFRYAVATDELQLLGPTWLAGEYTTVCQLSPDERFIYYLPGSHGKAYQSGTPVIQYETASGRRKVLAFLAPLFEEEHDYVPGGTYGMKLSADGGTLYVNFNGHAADRIRPKAMKPNGFGLTSFAAIAIPASER